MPDACRSRAIILVVDDNENNREVLAYFLTGRGYQVLQAHDGREAIIVATSGNPELILMDLSMPVLDGFGSIRVLRQVPELSHIPVIACTAHFGEVYKAKAATAGFDGFLSKPIDFAKLISLIDRFLRRS